MTFLSDWSAEAAFAVVLAGWLGFGVILAVGKKGSAKGAAKRDLKSSVGFLLQLIAYAIAFGFSRNYFSPLVPMSKTKEEFLSAVTALLAVASIWFCHTAARALGRQWALMARVIEGHELVRQGPYAIVRNPIYLAMLGMLLATGLAIARWQALLCAVVVFAAGTAIRIRTEEGLLRDAFGAKFDEYARRVPAFLPRLRRSPGQTGAKTRTSS
ncbi:MAG TPA: isoprenylcysteine carboxylmethyltransferase family protein [Candidatus Acidoferrales bacterium]|nr:isoprenylcysteine carboxylmethyltransferase family protein [Candidatus Acidoferrales bacterium]